MDVGVGGLWWAQTLHRQTSPPTPQQQTFLTLDPSSFSWYLSDFAGFFFDFQWNLMEKTMHIVLSFVEKRNWFLEYCCILLHLKNTFHSLVQGYVIKATVRRRARREFLEIMFRTLLKERTLKLDEWTWTDEWWMMMNEWCMMFGRLPGSTDVRALSCCKTSSFLSMKCLVDQGRCGGGSKGAMGWTISVAATVFAFSNNFNCSLMNELNRRGRGVRSIVMKYFWLFVHTGAPFSLWWERDLPVCTHPS